MMEHRNVYIQIEDYLANKLGRQPTNEELDEFLTSILTGRKSNEKSD